MSTYNPEFFEASRPSEKLLKHLESQLSDENPELLNDIGKTIKQEMLTIYPNYLTDDNTEIELVY